MNIMIRDPYYLAKTVLGSYNLYILKDPFGSWHYSCVGTFNTKDEAIDYYHKLKEEEKMISRMHNDLEQLALSYPGVLKTYAIQAGRELRVIVGADKIGDAETENLSTEIAKRIQDEMTYPGQVKITVIRETRAVSFAK